MKRFSQVLGVSLCLLTLAEVNYPNLTRSSQLALFALLGLTLTFLTRPLHPRWADSRLAKSFDYLLAAVAAGVCAYVVVQNEPWFSNLWAGGLSLGNRAGQETALDVAVGLVGLLVVLEAARRTVGWTLPLLAGAFLLYARFGSLLPDWLMPHAGYGWSRIAAQTFLQSQGVFGIALSVMFTYVCLFVVFGVLLEATGATGFIIATTRRIFSGGHGGAAKVSVVASGLMGSLSGSAVANTATTGTFTIPMMKSSGFRSETAAGVEAAASSGGALVPPVMGAGAYMMLEIVSPPVTYLEIVRAALVPALLYYLSLFFIVHFRARGLASRGAETELEPSDESSPFENAGVAGGVVFVAALGSLIVFLLAGYSVFRAVSLALAATVLVGAFSKETRLGLRRLLEALAKAARDMVPLIAAAGSVGIVIGVVTLTGVGTRLPALILPLAQDNLLAALALIMISSLVLGMGLPSAVCYLLMATLIGPVLADLGVVPLAAHLFLFYFGMMSMVTPPVALAAYAAASIAGSGILRTALTAFRFALVGFTLPYLFVFRPELLLLGSDGSSAPWPAVVGAITVAVAGIVALSAAVAGHLFSPLSRSHRGLLLAAAILLLLPLEIGPWPDLSLTWTAFVGGALLLAAAGFNRRAVIANSSM